MAWTEFTRRRYEGKVPRYSNDVWDEQGASEKGRFLFPCTDTERCFAVVLDHFDCSGGGFGYSLEQSSGGACQDENVARRVAGSIGVPVFPKCDILVAVHCFNSPVMSVQVQDVFGIRLGQAADQPGRFRFAFHDISGPDMRAAARDAGN